MIRSYENKEISKPTESTLENLGREFSKFLKAKNPELADKFKELVPDLTKMAIGFIEEKLPAQEVENFLRGFVASLKGIDQNQIKYTDLAELKKMASEAVESF